MDKFIQPVDLVQDSHQEDLDCPICGGKATVRFFFETAEEHIDCYCCGYMRKFTIINKAEQDKPDPDFEWSPQYAIEEKLGFGAYSIRLLNSDNIEVGAFATPEAEQFFIDSVKQIEQQVAYAKYTKFVDGKLEQVVLINTTE